MATPKTYTAFRRATGDLPLTIERSTETLPENIGQDDVLIKIHAVSLNFRDVAMLHGTYPAEADERGIVASDCAAEVVAIGSAVTDFKIGDRVSPIFNLIDLTGYEEGAMVALGGNGPGVLREFAVFEAKYLVHLPSHLSWEEASTIACAGVTAWTALNSPSAVTREDLSALLQGTGGVSMFALLICLAAGIQPIITSSSDEKLAAVKKLSPKILGINYRTNTDIAAAARELAGGRGVDFVVNNTGLKSIPEDINTLRARNGTISLIGFLDGFDVKWEPNILFGLMAKRAKLQGIGVGSKLDFEALNKFLEEKKVALAPVIDKVFEFNDSKAACEYLYSGKHTGKVVIRL